MFTESRRLTEGQKNTLDFISSFIKEKGMAPTSREIQEGIGVKSIRSVTQYLEVLEKKGYIVRLSGQHRGIQIVEMNNDTNFISVPILSYAGCDDVSVFAEETHNEYVTIQRSLLGRIKGRVFAVKAMGDSMEEADIKDGDYVLFEDTKSIQNNDIVVANVNGMAVIKQVKYHKGLVILYPRAKSDKYQPIIMKDNSLILGKFIQVIDMPEDQIVASLVDARMDY